MAITLNRFAAGDTNYISKMNSNATIIEAAVNTLQNQIAVVTGGGALVLDEIYKTSGIIGVSSWQPTFISDTDISLISGSVWFVNTKVRARSIFDQSVTFVGKTSGNYVLNIDVGGTVTVSSTADGDKVPIYTVEYNNPGFDPVVVNMPYLFDGDDYARMLSSDTYGVFTRVADRLSTIEENIGGAAATSYVDGFAKSGATENLSGNISTTDFHLSSTNFSGAFERGLVYWLEVSTTLEAGSLYDIEVYISDIDDPAETSQLVFQALALDGNNSPYVTRFPFFVGSKTGDDDIYLRLSNNGASAALFTYQWQAEKFA